jgi:hypothetical protein
MNSGLSAIKLFLVTLWNICTVGVGTSAARGGDVLVLAGLDPVHHVMSDWLNQARKEIAS